MRRRRRSQRRRRRKKSWWSEAGRRPQGRTDLKVRPYEVDLNSSVRHRGCRAQPAERNLAGLKACSYEAFLITTSDPAIKIMRLRPEARLPERATEGASGLDLYACLPDGEITLTPDPALVPTGVAIEIPQGYDAQVRPRSGLSLKGVGVAFGTIDADYRGEVLVTMFVYGTRTEHIVTHGDRIAQLVVARLADLPVVEVEALSDSARGARGHGSTGS